MLAHAPVHIHVPACHGGAVVIDFFHQLMRRERGGQCGELSAKALPLGQGDRGVARVRPFFAEERCPVHRILALEVADGDVFGVLACIHRSAVLLGQIIAQRLAHTLRGELVCVESARAGMCSDLFVHQRLRERRGVLLVVAEFAEANDVQHNVFVELLAILQSPLRTHHHRFRIVAIDVEHGRFNHLDHIGAIQRGAGVARIAGGEANLVVDHDMHRAAGVVATGLRQCQSFHHHALACKCGIAVHEHGQHLIAFFVTTAIHAGAHAAFHHRVDDLQMRWVESECQVHWAARRGHVAGEALVILHIT